MSFVSLDEVAEVFNGKTPAKSDQRETGHPVLKIRDVDDAGQFRGAFGSFVDHELAAQHKKKQVAPGDTLILNAAHNASYVGSKSFFATEGVRGALATGEWLLVRPDYRRLHAGFAHYWLTSVAARSAIRDQVKGIHLYPKDVARLSLPLPPLDERRRAAASTLSGGERQMLVVGRALMSRPSVLLLDEPSLGLAPRIVTQIFELVRGLVREEGLAVLLVEQNARSALSVADRGVVLNLGRVVADDDAAVLAGDDQLRHAYLGF